MPISAFLELEFLLLVFFSLVTPLAVYAYLYRKKSIARVTVLSFSVCLILMSGLDLALLSRLREVALHSISSLDDAIFVGELRLALYLLPAVFAGTGINLLSHSLIAHLTKAETRHDAEQRGGQSEAEKDK